MREIATSAGASTPSTRDLSLNYPPDVYSLSHVALPFPGRKASTARSPTRTTISACSSERWRCGESERCSS